MKKSVRLIAIAIMITTLLAAFPVFAQAVEPTDEGGHWVINAEKIDEILAGEAGEKTTAWDVPFLQVSPVLDGTINKAEYMEFELYEDYMSYMAINIGNTKEKFMEFYEMTKDGIFDAYWGWDGVYLYLAMEVRCVNGFRCTPEDMGGPSYLYAYNMFQVGISPVEAQGKDPDYVELGYGVNSNTGESMAHAWAGGTWYYPEAGEGKDFVGTYDAENQTVTYEVRIHLQKALKLDNAVVENGDQINLGWLISVNGETSSVNDYWQIGFCHGIGGQYSYKANQYMARVTFTGKDKVITPEEIEGISEEDKLYGLAEFIDMSKEDVVKTFTGEDAAIEYVTENGESFARITSLGDVPYVWSKTYPRALQSADISYITVKYRYTGDTAKELGVLYRNAYYPEYDLENMYAETIGNDGEWHTVTFYMSGEERWQNWIVNLGLAPFASEDALGQSVDIAFVKFYLEDPYELYQDTEFDPNKGQETTAPETEPVTEPTADTQAPETQAPAGTDATETTGAASTEAGCSSVVGMGAVAVLAAAAAFVALKKKED